jgi:formate dehydrogenase major subunit
VPGLGTAFGRGAATTAEWDLANAQCILVMGVNMAENHPIAYRFVMQAKQRGACIVHVDPRFTRTSATADVHAALRPGSDIAFLGGLINHVLNSERWNTEPFFREYVANYTNAATLVSEDFRDTEDLDGLFSGYNADQRQYDFSSWQYRGEASQSPVRSRSKALTTEAYSEHVGRLTRCPPEQDPTLQDPRCVLQILKRHFARYTPEMVERVCGVPTERFTRIAELLLANSGRERTTAIAYAVAWTQHTTGVQIIRAAGILQQLLGNIGRPGGGILALRGHATIQGSTDIPTLYNLLPGYLAQPHAMKDHETLADYVRVEYSPTGWWANAPKYIVSLLKAWYGQAAQEANDFCFDHLPRISDDYSQQPMLQAIHDGQIKGLFLMGQNPAVGGHDAGFVRRGLARLDWLVVRDAFENETAAFWYASPEVRQGQLDPRQIDTEIFLLPAALPAEKEGSLTNTHRLIQWHDKAIEPPADARSEPWFLDELGRRLRALYAADADQGSIRVRQLLDLTWEYPRKGGDVDVEAVLREINGVRVADGSPVRDFNELKDDGSTACGCWIYSGVMPEPGRNLARNRSPDPPDGPGTHLNWAYAWPANRRMLYNRASADPAGRPWSERKRYVWWDTARGQWTGRDVPDFPRTKPPDFEPDWGADPRGLDAHSGRAPFIMMADGLGWLYVPAGLQDGPLPTHYEPVESPLRNPLYGQQFNPMAKLWQRPENRYQAVGDPAFPYVITTYRLTEHHTGGTMSRYLAWLAETQPTAFVEISPELAAEHGIENGGWVTLWTARGEVEARALVTPRLRPLHLDGRVVHVVGMPWHFGYMGIARGDVANTLSAMVGDPNVSIHEAKAFTCNLRPGRKDSP